MPSSDDAVAWSQRTGLPVFPLISTGRTPALDSWSDLATTDITRIRQMWSGGVREHDYNIGVRLGDNTLVFDIDTKNNKDAWDTFLSLGGTENTLIVSTPKLGFHVYYKALFDPRPRIGMWKGIDLKSLGGYVAVPPSAVVYNDGFIGEYAIHNDAPIAHVPLGLVQYLERRRERNVLPFNKDRRELDKRADIEHYISYCQTISPAVEGEGGDNQTYKVAAEGYSLGLTEGITLDVMTRYYNPRCQPPWPNDDLEKKVVNAYNYAQESVAGSRSATTMFAGARVAASPMVPPTNLPPPTLNQDGMDVFPGFGEGWLETVNLDPPPVDWVIRDFVARKTVQGIVGTGGVGKGMLVAGIAASCAVGRDDFGPWHIPQCNVAIVSFEEDRDRFSEKLLAHAAYHGLPLAEHHNRIKLVNHRRAPFKLLKPYGQRYKANVEAVDQLADKLLELEADIFIIDPLTRVLGGPENDSDTAVEAVDAMEYVAAKANCAVLFIHQPAKTATELTGRGSGHFTFGPRMVFGLERPDPEGKGITGKYHVNGKNVVLLGTAKTNLTMFDPIARSVFEIRSYQYRDDYTVGVLTSGQGVMVEIRRKEQDLIGLIINELLTDAEDGRVKVADFRQKHIDGSISTQKRIIAKIFERGPARGIHPETGQSLFIEWDKTHTYFQFMTDELPKFQPVDENNIEDLF